MEGGITYCNRDGHDDHKFIINICIFGCVLPFLLATILSIMAGSSKVILHNLEYLPTIVPPAD